MIKEIHKHKVFPGTTIVTVPADAEVLRIDQQNDDIVLWEIHEYPNTPYTKGIHVQSVPTGVIFDPDPDAEYFTTLVGVGGWAVLHVFVKD